MIIRIGASQGCRAAGHTNNNNFHGPISAIASEICGTNIIPKCLGFMSKTLKLGQVKTLNVQCCNSLHIDSVISIDLV